MKMSQWWHFEDDESIFNFIFSLIENYDDKEDTNEVNLFDIKDDLDTIPIKKLRKLVALVIDSVDERTTEDLTLNEKLILCENEIKSVLK